MYFCWIIVAAIMLCCLILLWSWSGSFSCCRCWCQYFDLLVLVTVFLCLIHIWMVCCWMSIFRLCRKKRCCNVALPLGASIPESKRCTFYFSHIPDGNHSRPPRCQRTKANEEAVVVTIVPGASISSFREIPGCASFACWLGVSNLWRMPVFFGGICLGGVSELVFIHCKDCLWTLSGWKLSWKGLVLVWWHAGYMLFVWC